MKPRKWIDTELRDYDKKTLEVIVEARGVDVVGTGTNGAVVVDDMVRAIIAHQDTTGLNPSLVALPPPLKLKRYRVTGELGVFDHRKGDEFEMVMSPVQESQLLAASVITIIDDDAGAPRDSHAPDRDASPRATAPAATTTGKPAGNAKE